MQSSHTHTILQFAPIYDTVNSLPPPRFPFSHKCQYTSTHTCITKPFLSQLLAIFATKGSSLANASFSLSIYIETVLGPMALYSLSFVVFKNGVNMDLVDRGGEVEGFILDLFFL